MKEENGGLAVLDPPCLSQPEPLGNARTPGGRPPEDAFFRAIIVQRKVAGNRRASNCSEPGFLTARGGLPTECPQMSHGHSCVTRAFLPV
jgi:hypothetical protein